jgi:hypothetical protein
MSPHLEIKNKWSQTTVTSMVRMQVNRHARSLSSDIVNNLTGIDSFPFVFAGLYRILGSAHIEYELKKSTAFGLNGLSTLFC